jgi:hypothetical protein
MVGMKERSGLLGVLVLAIALTGCGDDGTTSRSTTAARASGDQPAPVVKVGSSQAPALKTARLRRCPGATPGTRRPVGGDWSASVRRIGCGAVGRFIFDRFLGAGLQTQLVTTREQSVRLRRVKCGIHPQPAGWRVGCARGERRFTFLLRP